MLALSLRFRSLFFVFSSKSYVFLHLVLSFLKLATLLLYFTQHFLSENILNKLLLAKPTVLKNISCFKRIIIIIWLTKYRMELVEVADEWRHW